MPSSYTILPFTAAERMRANAALFEWERRQNIRHYYSEVEAEFTFCCMLREAPWSGNATGHLKTMVHVGMLFHVNVAMMHDAQHRFGRMRIVS